MSTETEVKVKIDDPGEFCDRLAALVPAIVSARHFEDNQLLDYPDQRLKSRQCLLRIRFAEGGYVLTYKGPPRPNGVFKSREELETPVGEGATLLQVLQQIGLSVWFQYQKFRREFAVRGVHVAVDETPIGNYAEFEGSEDGIREVTGRLGIAEAQFLRSSYYALYLEHCRDAGTAPGFMVFEQ